MQEEPIFWLKQNGWLWLIVSGWGSQQE